MLSKAEVQYLKGQKQVSNSYERKLKCLIRKKIEALNKELPLISSIIDGKIKSKLTEILNKEEAPPVTLEEQNDRADSKPYSNDEDSATKFSNMSRFEEIAKVHGDVKEGLEGSKDSSYNLQTSEATKFGNAVKETATKNSNFDEKKRRERDLNPRGPHGPQAM